jgi:predicted DNA-binding antitoxin AbrB/MazE fold protein
MNEVIDMQACEAYYKDGRFVPLGFGKLPEGTRAIITLLNKTPEDVKMRLEEFDSIVGDIQAAADEPMPPIERMKFREVRP